MTNEEALRFLTYSSKNYETIAEGLISDADCEHERQWNIQQMELCDTAIKALKKQIPMKPYRDNIYKCSACNKILGANYECVDYCYRCGQRIDWSKDD